MTMTKKERLYELIMQVLHKKGRVMTWDIEALGRRVGLMGSSATRYGRLFCRDGGYDKTGWHEYRV